MGSEWRREVDSENQGRGREVVVARWKPMSISMPKKRKRKGRGPHGHDLPHTEVRVGYVAPNKEEKVMTEEKERGG
jgi:hypothetical protein